MNVLSRRMGLILTVILYITLAAAILGFLVIPWLVQVAFAEYFSQNAFYSAQRQKPFAYCHMLRHLQRGFSWILSVLQARLHPPSHLRSYPDFRHALRHRFILRVPSGCPL